ncbi:MAG: hypothetical protein ACTHNN_04185 [Xanthobacteraceae bacterium]
MRRLVALALTVALTAPAFAAEPSGCDKFKWPIDRERAALTAPERTALVSGASVTRPLPVTVTLALKPIADAGLPSPPERRAAEGTFAGYLSVKTSRPVGTYSISISAGAWIDVVQDGRYLKPKAFSGATDCAGIRKTMKFDLAASPFVVQVSGMKENTITLAILPAE